MQHRHIAKRFWEQGASITIDTSRLSCYNDLINLNIGDMHIATDSRIIDASCRDAKRGYTTYGEAQGDPELIAAIVDYNREEYGMQIDPREIYVTASSLYGMTLALIVTVNPGDELIVFTPYFACYRPQIELAGGRVVEVPTFESEGYAISEARLRAAITDKTRGIVFNNPVNPTGVYYGRGTLEMLARVAAEFDLLVYSDEIYTHYVFTGENFLPLRMIDGMAERTITVSGFSKNYLMTGWRIGYLMLAPHLLQTALMLNNNVVYTAPSISQRAAIEAIRLRDSIRETYIEDYRRRVFYAAERINRIPYLSVPEPQGTFYLFPNIEKTGLTAVQFRDALLERAHVLVTPGSVFGSSGEGHFRIACTVTMEELAEAFDRMEKLSF